MTDPVKADPPEGEIRCSDGCGRRATDDQDALDKAWTYLAISTRWRCPYCSRALREAATIKGTDEVTEDKLPPSSRGALNKETASTITPPSVTK